MKKLLKLTLAVVCVMSASSLFAQKFGRINTAEIVAAMPEAKEMQTNMEAFVKDMQETLEGLNVEFNNKMQEFQKNLSTMTEAVAQIKQKELNDMRTRATEFEQMAQQEYQKKYQELMAPIAEKAKAAIDAVGKAGGYLVVFDVTAGSLAYFDEAALTDIAPLVKKELDITE